MEPFKGQHKKWNYLKDNLTRCKTWESSFCQLTLDEATDPWGVQVERVEVLVIAYAHYPEFTLTFILIHILILLILTFIFPILTKCSGKRRPRAWEPATRNGRRGRGSAGGARQGGNFYYIRLHISLHSCLHNHLLPCIWLHILVYTWK